MWFRRKQKAPIQIMPARIDDLKSTTKSTRYVLIVNQCHIVEEELENLLQKTVTLSSKVYKSGWLDLNVFKLESEIRDIEFQLRGAKEGKDTAQKAINLMKNNKQKITPAEMEEIKSIIEICEQINNRVSLINSYLGDMLKFLESQTVVGALMNLIRGVQYAIQEITMSTIEIANLVVIPALQEKSSFLSRLLSGTRQKLLGGG
jgi:hypothetical protein